MIVKYSDGDDINEAEELTLNAGDAFPFTEALDIACLPLKIQSCLNFQLSILMKILRIMKGTRVHD